MRHEDCDSRGETSVESASASDDNKRGEDSMDRRAPFEMTIRDGQDAEMRQAVLEARENAKALWQWKINEWQSAWALPRTSRVLPTTQLPHQRTATGAYVSESADARQPVEAQQGQSCTMDTFAGRTSNHVVGAMLPSSPARPHDKSVQPANLLPTDFFYEVGEQWCLTRQNIKSPPDMSAGCHQWPSGTLDASWLYNDDDRDMLATLPNWPDCFAAGTHAGTRDVFKWTSGHLTDWDDRLLPEGMSEFPLCDLLNVGPSPSAVEYSSSPGVR